jgi:NAD(P)-dependent dehydrogenase (short-subunit alcohol dehydrogenase family)
MGTDQGVQSMGRLERAWNLPDLSSQVVVVTGASGNLGRAVSTLLAQARATRVLLDRSPQTEPIENPDQTLAAGGLDLTNPEAIAAVLDQAVQRFGRVDGLVSTVGAFAGGTPVHEQDWAVWEAMLTANLRTAVAACQAVVPLLIDHGGRIVLVGARPGTAGAAGMAAYSASKAAVLRLGESLADELKGRNVTVNCVLPSIMDTPQNRSAMPTADPTRWVPLEDVAQVILFLLSDAARSVTGASIPVYGQS